MEFDKDTWAFEDYFSAPDIEKILQNKHFVEQARVALADAKIGNHKFFAEAALEPELLKVWAAQESVITNHFSQVLLKFLSAIKNVHVRSLLMPVVAGEHSKLRNGIAFGSHPHLLSQLVEDLCINANQINPLECTVRFADHLSNSIVDWFYGLGFLGIGNEAMLVPEYEAVEIAFSRHFEREIFRPFLRANIEEDKSHSSIMDDAAAMTIQSDEDGTRYLAGALDGITARTRYYDELLAAC